MGSHIAIIGNIGAGKTTLATRLCEKMGGKLHLEGVEENPFLELFYQDPKRWAFASGMAFIEHSISQQIEIRSPNHPQVGVQERPALEQLAIFVDYRKEHGILTAEEAGYLENWSQKQLEGIPLPDSIIYLDLSTEHLQKRIRAREREFELSIPDSLLESFNDQYAKLIARPEIKERLITLDYDFDC